MRVLVAPDSFKGTHSAAQAAAAIGRGLEAEGVAADLCPVADGGEGTLAVLLPALGGETSGAHVHDPLGRPRAAGFALLEGGSCGLVEVAEASGLGLVGTPTPATAWEASSRGTGELVVAAVAAGAEVVVVAAGGSATTDGGAGALEAIAAAGGLRGARLVVLCDVVTRWEDCAATFGPQKGADAATVARLQERLATLAAELPRDPRGMPGGGAAGGLAGGLWAAHDAVLEPGAAWVLDALGVGERVDGADSAMVGDRLDGAIVGVRLDRADGAIVGDRLDRADAVVVGEGRLDAQSLLGKAPGELARRAAAAAVPCHAIAGSLAEGFSSPLLASVRIASDLPALEAAGAALARDLRAPGGPPRPWVVDVADPRPGGPRNAG